MSGFRDSNYAFSEIQRFADRVIDTRDKELSETVQGLVLWATETYETSPEVFDYLVSGHYALCTMALRGTLEGSEGRRDPGLVPQLYSIMSPDEFVVGFVLDAFKGLSEPKGAVHQRLAA
jgi:hypothetical protein